MQCMEPRFASSDVIWPFKAWLRLGPYQILAETKLDSILHIYNYIYLERVSAPCARSSDHSRRLATLATKTEEDGPLTRGNK